MALRRLMAFGLASSLFYAPTAVAAETSLPRIYAAPATPPPSKTDPLDLALRGRLAVRFGPELTLGPAASFAPSARALAAEDDWVGRALRELYRDRGYRPMFVEAQGLSRAGQALLDSLASSGAHGLFPEDLLPTDAWTQLGELRDPWTPLAQSSAGMLAPQAREALTLELSSELVRAPFSLSGDRWYRGIQVALDAQLDDHDAVLRAQWQQALLDRAPQLERLEWELALALVRYARAIKLDNLYAAPGNPALDVAREHLEARGYGEDTSGTMTGAPPIPQHINEITRSFDQWQHDELDQLLAAADGQLYLADALADAAPDSQEYRGLQAELSRYQRIAQQGDWLPVDAFGSLQDASAAQRRQLALRLHQEAYLELPTLADAMGADAQTALTALSSHASDSVSDAALIDRSDHSPATTPPSLKALEAGLLRWKAHHLLPLTPQVDLATRDALAVSVLERIAQLGLSLEKLRHARYAFDERNPHIRINIPAFRAAFWEHGEEQYHWRVIVGKAQGGGVNRTPEMSAWLTEIELNPFWYPPRRLMRHGSQEGRVVPPGPRNPMGRAKFIFPNADAVYMHDTNRRELFEHETRAVSAGCVRVDQAETLAATWIARDKEQALEAGEAFVDQRLRSGKRYRYYLREPLAVHIEYRSVYLSDTHRAVFATDLYGQDAPALEARLHRLQQQHPNLTPERRYDRYLRALRKQETAALR